MDSVANHLKMADQQRIHALLELGWSHRRIAREAGVDRETVARYARLGRSNPANPIVGEKPSTSEPLSQAVEHDAVIRQGVRQGLSAQRIWQDLVELYGYLTVQRYVRRVKRRGEVSDHLEHPPGEEAQVDFFKSPAPVLDAVDGRWRRPLVFRMTLSCSRHGYEEAVWSEDRASFLRAHEHAFIAIGGVPRVVRHDNLKAAVVRACLYDPDLSEVYEAFAQHWGFVPLPSRPRHPEEQGIQENAGGYVTSQLAVEAVRTLQALEPALADCLGLTEEERDAGRLPADVEARCGRGSADGDGCARVHDRAGRLPGRGDTAEDHRRGRLARGTGAGTTDKERRGLRAVRGPAGPRSQ
jgi:transposase